MISVAEFSMRRMHLPRVWKRSARLLPLTCLLSALAFQPPAAWAEDTPGTPPQPKTATDVVREMAPPPPLPTPTPPAGTGRRQREEAKAKAREQAQEKVQKAEQERQQASNDAARNPNDPAKQATDLEKQQKLDEAVTDAARLNDDVAQAEKEYRDAYKEAETAASNLAADTPDKTLKLAAAKRRYEAALEEAKARIARVFAERWNRQRFAEQMERRRQATQQGTQGTPQTQPGGATPGTGGGNIGQAQTPPTAAQVPKINVITDKAGGGVGYNTSGYKIGSSGSFGKGDRSRWGDYQYVNPQDDLPLGGPKLAPVEYVRVCDVYGAGYFYIPGTDTCLKIGGSVRVDLGNGFSFEFQTDNSNQYIGLRSREVIGLPGNGAEKNTETGFLDGPLRCFPNNGSCIIQVPPEQASAYGVPNIVGNLRADSAWGTNQVAGAARSVFQVRYADYQYGGSVAETTGQSTFPRVLVPQGFQADAYDFSVGDRTFRRFGYRCTRGLRLIDLVSILQMGYPRLENDAGRDKEPALGAGVAAAPAQSETLPQARLDLRPLPTRTRGRR
jgi:hypothetical protein